MQRRLCNMVLQALANRRSTLVCGKKQRSCVPQALLSHSLSSAIATFDLLCPFLSPNPHGSVHGMCTIHSIA